MPGGIPGTFWALRDAAGARVLKIRPPKGLPGVTAKQMKFDGRLPQAIFNYKNMGPIEVNLVAFSSLILGDTSPDYKDSSLPGAIFDFELVNTTDAEQEYAFYYSWQNLAGITGYYNERYWGANDNRETKLEYRQDAKYPGHVVLLGEQDGRPARSGQL